MSESVNYKGRQYNDQTWSDGDYFFFKLLNEPASPHAGHS